MSSEMPSLETLLQFPCAYTFRLVADVSVDLEIRCRAAAEEALGRPMESVVFLPSRNGRYAVVRLKARVQSAEEVRCVHAALAGIPGARTQI